MEEDVNETREDTSGATKPEDVSKLPDGDLLELRKSHYNKGNKYIEFAKDGKKYRAYERKLGSKKTLEIKLQSWKEAEGSREAYEMIVRYNLTKHRIWKINSDELQKDGIVDELAWNDLDEDVVDYLVYFNYGKPSLEQDRSDDEFLKNLMTVFLKEPEKLESILNFVDSNKSKGQLSEVLETENLSPSNSSGSQTPSSKS